MIYNSDIMKGIFSLKPDNAQEEAADFVANPHLFLSGPASSGKTSAALLRLQQILTSNPAAPGSSTLVLVPQRSLATPYQEYLREEIEFFFCRDYWFYEFILVKSFAD